MSEKSRSHLNLIRAFIGFVVLGGLIFFGVTLFFTNQRVTQMQNDVLRTVVDNRSAHVAHYLVDHLQEHWIDLEDLAVALPFADRATFRSLLSREVAGGDHMAWAAYVNASGEVTIGSRQQREGETVATEEWFLAAQRGPTIGFALNPNGEERLVMTAPVKLSGPTAAGYLTFHFRPEWLAENIRHFRDTLAIDILVFDDRGRPFLKSFDFDAADLDLVSVRNALAGQRTVVLEEWTALGRQFAASIAITPTGSMPALGWRAVVLTTPDQFVTESNSLRVSLATILGAVAVVLLAMSMGFIRIFLVPLHRLVENADAIASGAEIVPQEEHRTAELSILSSALSRLQGRVTMAEDRADRLQEELDRQAAKGTKSVLH